ncbi:hypothetical protein Btru_025311 [Bulinus truncatus]|nr:hypothetical protein Btru_025311 [Bulinus truncatus]
MSVLEIYLQWVNSVLAEAGGHVGGSQAVQDGQVLCQLIDILAPSACLVSKVKSGGNCTALDYVNAALDHMQKHGIRIKFSAEDIVNNEIKSILDILWILILNYSIHYIGHNAFQRSVGSGKKNLLEWCMEQLGTSFDLGKSLSENLCQGDWFIRLLEKAISGHLPRYEDKAEYIDALLKEIENSYGIKKEIVKAADIVDGTVDEHTLMIYLSLFKRRCPISNLHARKQSYGENAAAARDRFADKRFHQVYDPSSSRSDDKEGEYNVRSMSNGGNGNHSSPAHRSSSYQSQSIDDDTLYETVIENVAYTKYHRGQKKQHGELDGEIPSLPSPSARWNLQRQDKVNSGSFGSGSNGGDYQADRPPRSEISGRNTCDDPSSDQRQGGSVTIKRPKDYILQWEDTMDRLSLAAAHENLGPTNTLPMGRSRSCDLGRLNPFFSEIPEKNLSSRRSKSTEFSSINSHSLHSHSVDSVLNKFPQYLQEKAKSASKFFLQADLPEVSELLKAIQMSKVRPYRSGSQSLSSNLDDGEQTMLKSVGESTYSAMDLPNSHDFTVPFANRFHSLSPRRRRAVSPILPENDGERGSNTMLSIYPRDRSLSPIGQDFKTQPNSGLTDSRPGFDLLSYSDHKFDLKMKTGYKSLVRDSSPSPDRRGGTGRIPRREAWELQRRVQDSCDVNTESQMMDILSQEIQELKEKVDLMEEDKLERRRSLSRTRLLPDVSPGSVDLLSTPTLQYSRERATSCPLLTISSQSPALRPTLLRQDYKSEVNVYQPLKPRSPQNLLSTYSSSNPHQLSHAISPARVAGPRVDTSFPSESLPMTSWRQLIAKRQLTEAEVTELKQALACAVADNDMLASRLDSARDEVYDKLRHTNSVLDDCRHHLAKSQVGNMEFRSLLEKERHKNLALENKVKEMEHYFSELKANNEELEDELGHTTVIFNKSMAETIPEVQALKLENAHLASQLAEAENENDFLREDVQNLKQRHSKAMSTIEELRDILSKVRKERQELFMELAAFDRREQSAKIAKIINSYKEKGAKDEEESERNVNKVILSSVSKNNTTGHCSNSKSVAPPSSQRKYYSDDDCDDSSAAREIYPHRRSYTPHSRHHSPQQPEPRSRSVSPHSVKYFSAVDHAQDVESSPQYSKQNFITRNDYRPFLNHSSLKRNTSPTYISHIPSSLSQGKTYHSMKDLSGRKSRSPSPRPGILKGKEVFRAESTVPLRSPSASYVRCSKRNLTPERTSSLRDISLDEGSLDDLPLWKTASISKERPLHKKSGSGEIAKIIQREFDQEDQFLQALSKSSVLQNKSWFELQSNADDSDTGINSSMSSYDYSLSIGKNTPILTEEQRRYADQLVQKYTANVSM